MSGCKSAVSSLTSTVCHFAPIPLNVFQLIDNILPLINNISSVIKQISFVMGNLSIFTRAYFHSILAFPQVRRRDEAHTAFCATNLNVAPLYIVKGLFKAPPLHGEGFQPSPPFAPLGASLTSQALRAGEAPPSASLGPFFCLKVKSGI